MRRKDREITDFEQQLDIIRKCDSCVLAFNDEGFPYLVPMNFGMEVIDEQVYLYFHCALKGTKLDLIEKDNRVTFEMDCGHDFYLKDWKMSCTMGYSSVIGHGTIEIVPEEERLHGLKVLMHQYHADDFAFDERPIPVTNVLKLTVQDMTGKRRNVRE